jgi:hypothetical protein
MVYFMENLDKKVSFSGYFAEIQCMKKRIFGIALCMALICGGSFYAEEQPTEPSPALEKALAAQNADDILAALNSETSDEGKSFAEAAVLAEARKLVFAGNLDLASKYAETVLLFDFMNNDAQDLYISIEDQKKVQIALEEKKKRDAEEKEQARLKAEEEKKVLAAQQELKAREEQKAKDDQAFLESVQVVSAQNFSFSGDLAPASSAVIYASSFTEEYTREKATRLALRVPANLGIRFSHPYVIAAIKGSFAWAPVTFSGGDKLMEYGGRLSVGTPLTGIPLCLTGGIAHYGFSKDSGVADTTLVTGLTTPSIGLSVENLRLTPNVDVTASARWLVAPINMQPSLTSFQGNVSARVLFGAPSALRFYIEPSVSGYLHVSNARTEWICAPAILAGVLINEYR